VGSRSITAVNVRIGIRVARTPTANKPLQRMIAAVGRPEVALCRYGVACARR
jgi:hypothetical protein